MRSEACLLCNESGKRPSAPRGETAGELRPEKKRSKKYTPIIIYSIFVSIGRAAESTGYVSLSTYLRKMFRNE